MMELNLGNNELKELPGDMGRMTRLVINYILYLHFVVQIKFRR